MRMKRVAALMCAAVVALTGSAFANPSISALTVTLDPAKNANATIPAGTELIVSEIKLDAEGAAEAYAANTFTESEDLTADQIAKIVEGIAKVNDEKAKETVSPEQFVKDYLGMTVDAENPVLTTNTNEEVALDKLSFITVFADIALTRDGGMTKEYTDENGNVIQTDATMSIDELKDVKDLEGYLYVAVDTTTGEAKFVDLKACEESFDPTTGEITVPLPCLGPFALAQKLN